jgi:hypothetical protein
MQPADGQGIPPSDRSYQKAQARHARAPARAGGESAAQEVGGIVWGQSVGTAEADLSSAQTAAGLGSGGGLSLPPPPPYSNAEERYINQHRSRWIQKAIIEKAKIATDLDHEICEMKDPKDREAQVGFPTTVPEQAPPLGHSLCLVSSFSATQAPRLSMPALIAVPVSSYPAPVTTCPTIFSL